MLPQLSLVVLATTLSLHTFAAPACFPMEQPQHIDKRAEYLEYYNEYGPGPIIHYAGYGGGGVRNYCKRSPSPLPAPNPAPAPAPEPVASPAEAKPDDDGANSADVVNASTAYLACYYIYSSARVKREVPGLTEHEIEKRCGKFKPKSKRSTEPEPEANPLINLFPDPDGGAGGSPNGGGFDGGTWPGDVGDGFLQCYTVYTTDKRDLGDGEALEKRCGKAKREAEDMVIKRDKPKYANYDRYVPVKD